MANMTFEQLLFNSIKNGQVTVKSVYDIWLELGNSGTPEDFLNSLKGEDGTHAIIVKDIIIASTDWVSDNGIYKATILNELITSDCIVNVDFSRSINEALISGVVGYSNTIDGGVELYSNFQPSTDFVVNYCIIMP